MLAIWRKTGRKGYKCGWEGNEGANGLTLSYQVNVTDLAWIFLYKNLKIHFIQVGEMLLRNAVMIIRFLPA